MSHWVFLSHRKWKVQHMCQSRLYHAGIRKPLKRSDDRWLWLCASTVHVYGLLLNTAWLRRLMLIWSCVAPFMHALLNLNSIKEKQRKAPQWANQWLRSQPSAELWQICAVKNRLFCLWPPILGFVNMSTHNSSFDSGVLSGGNENTVVTIFNVHMLWMQSTAVTIAGLNKPGLLPPNLFFCLLPMHCQLVYELCYSVHSSPSMFLKSGILGSVEWGSS